MKSAFVLVFPQNIFVDSSVKKQQKFNDCIKKRYLNKGFDVVIINYKNSTAKRIEVDNVRVVEADISFEESIMSGEYPDFEKLAEMIVSLGYDKIVVGGFHAFDCVERFANAVYKRNQNVIVDTDLTDMFDYFMDNENWDEENFDPDLKLRRLEKHFAQDPERLLKRYSNPIYNISQDLLEEIENSK